MKAVYPLYTLFLLFVGANGGDTVSVAVEIDGESQHFTVDRDLARSGEVEVLAAARIWCVGRHNISSDDCPNALARAVVSQVAEADGRHTANAIHLALREHVAGGGRRVEREHVPHLVHHHRHQ